MFTLILFFVNLTFAFEPTFKYMRGEYWGQSYINKTILNNEIVEERIPHGRGKFLSKKLI